MRSTFALIRAAWLTATSYRLATLLSLVGLLASVVPIYFISRAVQDLAQASIQREGGDYFGFIVLGIAATYVLASAASAIPSVLAGSIGSGAFEALLVTRTPLPLLLLGMSGYRIMESLLRALLLLGGAAVAGVAIDWWRLPLVLPIVLLTIVAYGSVGLVAGALVLAFRTSGPLVTAAIAGSGLLGGVYYSTTVIPGWLRALSDLVPLTHGLRASRMLLLGDAPVVAVLPDVGRLTLLAGTGAAIGMLAFGIALRHARRTGTLAQY